MLALLMSGCGPSKEELAKQEEAALIAKYQTKVANSLKDPNSAQFRDVKLIAGGKGICGEINAKNSYGGYDGFKVFMLGPDGVPYILHQGLQRKFAVKWAGMTIDDWKKSPDLMSMSEYLADIVFVMNIKGWEEC